MLFEIIWTKLKSVKCKYIFQMIDLPSEKIIHKFLFFLVDFVRKFAPVFILTFFLGVLKMLFLKGRSLVYLAPLPGIVHAC